MQTLDEAPSLLGKAKNAQLCLFDADTLEGQISVSPTEHLNLGGYDRYIIAFSGGKDSLACLLHLLEMGIDKDKIHLHHHLVDGREGSTLMDWPCTEAYCNAIAKEFGVNISYSWRQGGFEREMMRNNSPTAPVMIPGKTDTPIAIGGNGPANTRLKFPQVSADLSVRWCSSYLKIDAMSAWMVNDEQFLDGHTLVLTGERAEESAARSRYALFEPHRSDRRNGRRVKRHIDHWRPVHQWTEEKVWEIISRWKVIPHPAYFLGFGRCSCRVCVFGSPNQWATVRKIAPEQFNTVAKLEKEFNVTIHRKLNVIERANSGIPHDVSNDWVSIGNSKEWSIPVITEKWTLPSGAYGESCGPT